MNMKSVLTALFFSTIVFTGCNLCDDKGSACSALTVEVDPNAVPEGGHVELTFNDGTPFVCDQHTSFACFGDGLVFDFRSVFPETLNIRIFNAEGDVVDSREITPTYPNGRPTDKCYDNCDYTAVVSIMPEP